MKTVKITEDFEGYPQATSESSGRRQAFRKGDEVEVPAAFADLIIEKGHAREVGARAARKASNGAADKPAEKAAEPKE